MKFFEIVMETGVEVSQDSADLEITAITTDSRKVTAGNLFFALPGAKTHGAQFINDAIAKGAKVIVVSKGFDLGGALATIPPGVHTIAVDDPQSFLAKALNNFYHHPSLKLRLIGITGTNGKTTITYFLEALFSVLARECGVIGTVNHRYGGRILKAGNTTPGLVENFQLLMQMVQHEVEYCAMEVSSHALDQRRVEGLNFPYAIFTNLTSDHLDYHKNREAYFLAKAKLFTNLSPFSRSIINVDDEFGLRLVGMASAPVWTYGIKNKADFTAENITLNFDETTFDLVTPIGKISIKTRLIGRHNIYNILSVAAVGVGERIPLDLIKNGLESLTVVPGRLERIHGGQNFHVFVDYAHTEDALDNVLSSIRAVKKTRIITVFGCGGDRDKTKRPKMAAVVERLSDFAIVTNDNPRTEDPEAIAKDILGGFKNKNYKVILDREEAIKESLHSAKSGEVVLIAGKGHEDYQIFKDKTVSFDERKIVLQHLKAN